MSIKRLGHKHSEETKKKMSLSGKGKHKYWLGKKLPIEVRIKMSEARKGEKNHLWRGGITKLRLQIRNSFQYRQWINEVFIKDNFTCKECNKRGGRLSAHHIKSFSSILSENTIQTLDEAIKCNELWNIDNGMTLCKPCHIKTPNYGRKSVYATS